MLGGFYILAKINVQSDSANALCNPQCEPLPPDVRAIVGCCCHPPRLVCLLGSSLGSRLGANASWQGPRGRVAARLSEAPRTRVSGGTQPPVNRSFLRVNRPKTGIHGGR